MNRLALAACVALTLFVAACDDKVALNFDKVATGMNLSEVEALLGKGTEQQVGGMSISGAGIAGGAVQNSQSTYTWKMKKKEVSVTFAGGKVVSKAGM